MLHVFLVGDDVKHCFDIQTNWLYFVQRSSERMLGCWSSHVCTSALVIFRATFVGDDDYQACTLKNTIDIYSTPRQPKYGLAASSRWWPSTLTEKKPTNGSSQVRDLANYSVYAPKHPKHYIPKSSLKTIAASTVVSGDPKNKLYAETQPTLSAPRRSQVTTFFQRTPQYHPNRLWSRLMWHAFHVKGRNRQCFRLYRRRRQR